MQLENTMVTLPLTPPPTEVKERFACPQADTPESPTRNAIASPEMILNKPFRPPVFHKTPTPCDHSTQALPSPIDIPNLRQTQGSLFLPSKRPTPPVEDSTLEDSDDESVICLEDEENHGVSLLGRPQARTPHLDSALVRQSRKIDQIRRYNRGETEDMDLREHSIHSRNLQRHRNEVSDDEEVEYSGRSQRLRRSSGSDEAPTPLRALSVDDDDGAQGTVCRFCGCMCAFEPGPGPGPGGRGTGSNVLPPHVRAGILDIINRCLREDLNAAELLLDPKQTLFDRLHRANGVRDWKDIAQMAGARREDFDRVRHTARWMQQNLPNMMRQGRI